MEKDSFGIWKEKSRMFVTRTCQDNQRKSYSIKMLTNLLNEYNNKGIRNVINKFKLNRRITDIQRNFLKRLLLSKAGMVVIAFRKIQTLPEKRDDAAFAKANRFEKGLSSFVDRTLRQSFNSFRTELDEGQAVKKRAVIQLINTTMGGQKKSFNRWITIISENKLYERCSLLSNLFDKCSKHAYSSFSTVFRKKQYDLAGINSLNKYFVLLSKNTNTNTELAI